MATLPGIIRDTVKRPFRHAYVKRRVAATGLYEADWQDITEFVERYGSLDTRIDDVRLNQFTHSGVQMTVRNDNGEFNPETEGKSIFYGYFTRVRTLLKIDAGYTDGSGNSFPTDTTQGVFIMTGDINVISPTKSVTLNAKSLNSVFEEVRSDEIAGISSGSLTASEIIAKIRDATDGSGNFLFRYFITSTAWDIQSTTTIYTGINTTTVLENYSVWELMKKLSEVENFVVYISRSGGLVFGDRLPNTNASIFSFYGAGFRSPNIISLNSYREAIDKLFTHIRFKYIPDDTATSFLEAGTATVISPTSAQWKYGRRTYEFENEFFSNNTASAQTVITTLVNSFSNLKSELSMDVEFCPHLELGDHIDVSYQENQLADVNLWDARDWASSTATTDSPIALIWADETSGTIGFIQKSFRIIGRKTNLDNFVTSFSLREI